MPAQAEVKTPLTAKPVVCPICGNGMSKQLYRFEPALWIPGRVVRCSECRTIYKVLADSAKPLGEYYGDAFAALDYWNQEEAALNAFRKIWNALALTLTPSGLSLLDVGCGPGVFLKMAQEGGFKSTGLELNADFARKAREIAKTEVIEGDFQTAALVGREFDVVTLFDLIEHLPDPVAGLKRVHQLLKPGGHVVVYTPNHSSLIVRVSNLLYRLTLGTVSRPIVEIFDNTHVVFFDVRTLALALTTAGFEVTKTVLLKYDPSRSRQATGVSALVLRSLEAISPMIRGQFRILMFGKKR